MVAVIFHSTESQFWGAGNYHHHRNIFSKKILVLFFRVRGVMWYFVSVYLLICSFLVSPRECTLHESLSALATGTPAPGGYSNGGRMTAEMRICRREKETLELVWSWRNTDCPRQGHYCSVGRLIYLFIQPAFMEDLLRAGPYSKHCRQSNSQCPLSLSFHGDNRNQTHHYTHNEFNEKFNHCFEEKKNTGAMRTCDTDSYSSLERPGRLPCNSGI